MVRNPITGIADCCARPTSGHAAAAPPSSVTNSRRLTSGIGLPPPGVAGQSTAHSNLPRRGRQVLGVNLNCFRIGALPAPPPVTPNGDDLRRDPLEGRKATLEMILPRP